MFPVNRSLTGPGQHAGAPARPPVRRGPSGWGDGMKLAVAFAIGLAATPACAAENAGAAAPLVVCTPAAAVAAPAAALEPFAAPLPPLCPHNRVPQPIG